MSCAAMTRSITSWGMREDTLRLGPGGALIAPAGAAPRRLPRRRAEQGEEARGGHVLRPRAGVRPRVRAGPRRGLAVDRRPRGAQRRREDLPPPREEGEEE